MNPRAFISLIESSHELSYSETLYRDNEEVPVTITATYYDAVAGMPPSDSSGGSPPDPAFVDYDSIRAVRSDGTNQIINLDDDELADAKARLDAMVEDGYVDDFGADDQD